MKFFRRHSHVGSVTYVRYYKLYFSVKFKLLILLSFSFLKYDNPHEWLQVDLGRVKRITGVIVQGASSLMTQMMVTEFAVSVSHNKLYWSTVLEDSSQNEQVELEFVLFLFVLSSIFL